MEGAIISLTEGAVRGILCKLGGLLAQNSWPVQRLHGEVQYIKDELESMNAFLRSLAMSSSEGHDEQVRVWMKQVREIAYDAEDCIDEFVRGSELSVGDGGGAFMSSLRRYSLRLLTTLGSSLGRRHRRVAAQLHELKTRARDAGERRSRYGVLPPKSTAFRTGDGIRTSGRLDPRLHALFTEEAQLVGIEGPRDELVGWIMEEEPRLRVLAVVGFGGLGKTTLARMVCGSPRVKGADFQCSPLLIVSQTLNVRALFQHMLRELIQRPRLVAGDGTMDDILHGMENWETALLADKLRRYLQDKRYIVILDDIWTSSAWENIRCVFPDNNKGSRIIITTRNEDVANICCFRSQDRIYKIQRLSDTASRELFLKRIFGLVDGTPNNELEEISNSILKKCGGLPLAIVSIGSLLASKPKITKQEWQKVCDNLGSELETNPTLEGTKQVLTLSYNDLPYHLKACFLYLSIFPENHVIKRGPLVRMWIAEGFVTQKHGMSMEEVGDRYFDEFVARSMVQPVKIDWNGKVRSCRVHDIMVEVIRSKSLEENFASYFYENGTTLVSHDKIRRLSIQSSNHSMERMSTSLAHVRTFRMSPSMEETPFFFAQLQLLRVLDMQGSNCLSNKDLDSICKFFQLKYLSIRNTSISKLPRLIGRLNHLETLDIRETLIKKLPSSGKNLICLKHLLVGHNVQLTRTGSVKFFRNTSGLEITPGVLRNMASLQSVGHIEIKKQPSLFQEISLLRNLRKLNVLFSGVEANWKPFLELLCKLPGSVNSLSIHIFDGAVNCSSAEMLASVESPPLLVTSFSITGKLERLPPWVASLRNVSTFTLRNNGLHADAIDILGDLPNLLCVKLYNKSYADDSLVFPRGKFVKLKLLIIDNLENIDKVCFEEGSVPCLERLTLSFLRDPEYGISGLENLLNLREIEFFGNIILSVVTKVVSCVKTHPNSPRVIGDKWNIVTEYA